MTACLACGSCTDGSLLTALPFLFYWFFAFLLWSIVAGLPLSIWALASRTKLAMQPPLYFILAIGVVAATVPLTMGSLFVPMTPFLLVWVSRLAKGARAPKGEDAAALPRVARVERRVHRVFLLVAALLVPVAYVRLYLQANPEHVERFLGLFRSHS